MGRTREFDEGVVLAAATAVFCRSGYAGTSVDRLVAGTGLHRGSLYGAFGSKRGLFLACLRALPGGVDASAVDLLLVALLDLAPTDPEIREEAAHRLAALALTPAALGSRLLDRAGLAHPPQGDPS